MPRMQPLGTFMRPLPRSLPSSANLAAAAALLGGEEALLVVDERGTATLLLTARELTAALAQGHGPTTAIASLALPPSPRLSAHTTVAQVLPQLGQRRLLLTDNTDQPCGWLDETSLRQVLAGTHLLPPFGDLLDRLPIAIAIHAPDGSLIYSNRATRELFPAPLVPAHPKGPPHGEPPTWGSDWQLLDMNGTPLARADHPVQQVLRHGWPITDTLLGVRTSDGNERWGLLSAFPERDQDGTVSTVTSAFMDVSELRDAQLRLARLNRLYTVLSRTNSAIVRLRSPQALYTEICHIAVEEGEFLFSWVGIFEPTRGDVVPVAHHGHEAGYLATLQEIGVFHFNGPTAAAIRENRYFSSSDIARDPLMAPWRAAALERGYRSSAAVPIRIAGHPIGALMFYAATPHYFQADIIALLMELADDVSFALDVHAAEQQRQQAERALTELNTELEERVRQRTRQLEATNRELESFSYSVSHDLRAPLRAIDGFSDLLLRGYREQLDETGRNYLDRVRRNAHRMRQLIEDLLKLSRLGRGRLSRSRVDLSALAHQTLAELALNDPVRTVESQILGGLVVEGDRGLLQAVMENLLANAWKFTRPSQPARIEVGLAPCEQGGALFIRDNGVGFDMHYATKLFTPFQRLHCEQEFEGNGIGLATVMRIVQRHEGALWAEAQPGAGATFYVHLPGLAATPAGPPTPPFTAAPPDAAPPCDYH